MDMETIRDRGLVILGCGKMGSAMLRGWLDKGVSARSVWVLDPHPNDWLRTVDVRVNARLPTAPAIVLIAVKPQMMGDALPEIVHWGGGATLFLSIAAGTPIREFENVLGPGTPVIRAMPNTPAAIGRGITAIVGNSHTNPSHLNMAETLLAAVGQVVRLEDEGQMDAVTAVSGSGPAYVFHLIETLAQAGEAEGLPANISLRLARATVAGAGALAEDAEVDPGQLRIDVTSPGGTTAAALKVLMDESSGFPALLPRAVNAAAERSRELGR